MIAVTAKRGLCALLLLGGAVSTAVCDQVLDRYDDSLTTMLPTSASSTQDVRPDVVDRLVNIDGSARTSGSMAEITAHVYTVGPLYDPPNHPTPFPNIPGGGAGGSGCGQVAHGAVELATGTTRLGRTDIALPAPGFRWIVGRSYSGAQEASGGGAHNSDGPQGRNWFQGSQPELVLYEGATDDEDVVYVLWGAAAYTEFKRVSASASVFKSKNGANAAIEYVSGSPDTWVLTTPDGMKATFFGDNTASSAADWQLWKIEDPAGNVAFVGAESSASTAVSSGYSGGRMTTAYDTAERRYTYTYTTLDSISRLTRVKVESQTGSDWSKPTGVEEVARVDYTYYVSTDSDISNGTAGDLKLATVTMPLSDSGVSSETRQYFRYWTGAWSGSNLGEAHLVRHVVESEGARRYSLVDSTLFAATDAQIKPYASESFEYDSSRRVTKTWAFGACGCGGGPNGASSIRYSTNGSHPNSAGYDIEWKTRAVVEQPDGIWVTYYIDEAGQGLSVSRTPTDPASSTSTQWSIVVSREHATDAALDGLVHEVAMVDNVTAYNHSAGTFTQSSSAGVVRTFEYETSGDRKGLLLERRHSNAGTSGSQYLDWSQTYVSTDPSITIGSGTTITLKRPMRASSRIYTEAITSGTSGSHETTVSYDWHDDGGMPAIDLTRPKVVTTTLPAVSAANNGENAPHTTKTYLRKDGTVAFTESIDGIFSYTQYENGQPIKQITDCQTNHTTDFPAADDPNGAFGITETSAGLRLISEMSYDAQGRSDTSTRFAHGSTEAEKQVRKTYYSKLADGRLVTLVYADYESGGTPKYFGPISCTVSNHSGTAEESALIAISQSGITTAIASHIDETDSDVLDAVGIGTVARLSTQIYDDYGHHLEETRSYFDIPTTLPGTDGTHYDATMFAYDDASRRIRTESPDGTITRTVFDSNARPHQTFVGTADSTFTGTAGSSINNNMTLVSERVYDSVGRVSATRSFYGTGVSDYRETSFLFDGDGRRAVTIPPAAPYTVQKYDHVGRAVAVGRYSSSTGLTASTDPTATTSTNRIGLSESAYDERGRVWKSTRWKIDQTDGSKDDSLTSESWFDSAGRVVKVDGEALTKTTYDRIGRTTHSFVLATDNDTAYADADDVAGDIVLEERQMIYDDVDGNVLFTVAIQRLHGDYKAGAQTLGALDSNADGDNETLTAADVTGRVSIAASWYDDRDRATDRALYGTNGGSNFTRPSSVPARSATILVTSYDYNDDGTTLEVTDPRNLVTRTLYDDAGRTVATIANYVNGTPSSATGDDDIYTRMTYTDGRMTEYWVDVDGDGTQDAGTDQVTTYTYGVSKGVSAGDSLIASNALLQKVTYPDSTGASDAKTFAYDTSGARIWRKDQAGTIIETTYDSAGRMEHDRATTLGTGVDNAIRRITHGYDDHGRVSTITSYDNATAGSGSVVNQVEREFDDWGGLAHFNVDPDSVIDAVGGVPTKSVDYTHEKATSGRNTIRRTGVTLGGSKSVTYDYGAGASNDYSDEASRLQSMTISSVVVAEYAYLGVGTVVGIDYPQPDVFQHRYGSTSGSYPDLDRFGRVINSRWTKDLTTDLDFFSVTVSYDENSNPLTTEDEVFTAGFDVKYAYDDLDRLTDADEGTLSGGSITSRTRREEWETISQTGNFILTDLDLDGDGAWGGTDEYTDKRSFSLANALNDRNTDDFGAVEYTLTHDAAGNLTDDGKDYTYVYDAWNRLRQIKNRSNSKVVSEHEYYGNGFRAGEHYDSDESGTVDSSDEWFWFGYDERWRIVATFRGSDSDPKEEFVHHTAGLGGFGGSSYIDTVVLRDRDTSTDWNDDAGDGTYEERLYYCQNWRHDVVALVTSAGAMKERVRYSAYGVPFGQPLADCNGDGTVGGADLSVILGAWGTADARADLDLDGNVDGADQTIYFGESGASAGRKALSLCGNRFGYAGYRSDAAVVECAHVRARAYSAVHGLWLQRDPAGLVDGASLQRYAQSSPIRGIDPSGLASVQISLIDHDPGTETCGEQASRRWRYEVDRSADTESEAGYIIQLVEVTCYERGCKTGCACTERFPANYRHGGDYPWDRPRRRGVSQTPYSSYAYLEAFFVPQGNTTPSRSEPDGANDIAFMNVPDNRCLYYRQTALARFFTLTELGLKGQGISEQLGRWRQRNDDPQYIGATGIWSTGRSCTTTAGFLPFRPIGLREWGGLVHGHGSRPPGTEFWRDPWVLGEDPAGLTVPAGAATRRFEVTGNCCNGTDKNVDVLPEL